MIWYSRNCVRTIMNPVFDSTKVNGLLFIILTYLTKFRWVLCDWSFQAFGWDIDMRRIRSGKTLRLGMPKAPQGNIQGRLKYLSLGMPRKASPLSSSKLSVYLTRSYIFICTWYLFCLEHIFNFTCCLNKIIGSEILNEKEPSHG